MSPDQEDEPDNKTKRTKALDDDTCAQLFSELTDKLHKHLSGPFLEKTKRILTRDATSGFVAVLKNAQELEDTMKKQQALIRRLVGGPEYQVRMEFPKTPSLLSISDTLATCRQYILDTVGDDRDSPTPTSVAAGYLSRCMEDVANGRLLDEDLAPDIYNFRMHLESPHAQQALLGALFCRCVFQSPEPMCKAYHPKALTKHLEAMRMQGTIAFRQ